MSVLCIPTFPRLLFSLLPPTSPPLALLSTSSLSLSLSHPLSPCPPCHRNSPPLPSRACRSRASRSHPATSHRSCAGCFRSERVERHYFPPTLSTSSSSSLSLSCARSLPISLCIPTPPSLLNAPCRLRHLLPTRLTSPRARADCFRGERVERHGKLALCAACCLAARRSVDARARAFLLPPSLSSSRSLARSHALCLSLPLPPHIPLSLHPPHPPPLRVSMLPEGARASLPTRLTSPCARADCFGCEQVERL